MCGRYTFTDPEAVKKALARLGFKMAPETALPKRFNVAPTQEMPIVINRTGPEVVRMRWGSQWRDENNRVQLSINARSEKAAYTRFKHAVESRRCLVPASSFFEWDRSKEPSIPHLFGVTGQGAFWIAGAWEEPTAEFGAGYLVLTTKPNDLVQRIHDRMPVILRDDAARAWLSPGHLSQGKINEFCPSYPAAEMSDTVVSLLANNARNDGPECVEPYHAPDPSVTRPGELF